MYNAKQLVKQRKKLEALSNEELTAKASRTIQRLELMYGIAAKRLDEKAGSNRTGIHAEAALKFKGFMHLVKAIHCDVSIWACRVKLAPMPREGGR